MRDHALLDKTDLHLIRVVHQPTVSESLKRWSELAGAPFLVRSGAVMVASTLLVLTTDRQHCERYSASSRWLRAQVKAVATTLKKNEKASAA